jgi:hypothetical protein
LHNHPYMCMKRILILTWILATQAFTGSVVTAQGQPSPLVPVDPDTKTIMYREVVNEQGLPGYLYDKAIEWFRFYYPNPTAVYTVQDRVNGKVEGIGRMKIFYFDADGNRLDGGQVMYTIKMEFKENRYRYTLTDFLLKSASRYPLEKWLNKSDPAYNAQWDAYLYQVDTTMQRLLTTMKAGMKPTVKKTDEW